MKRIIKISLTILFILTTFLALPEKKYLLKVDAAEETINGDVAIEEVIVKIKEYLNDYLKEFSADDFMSEEKDPKKYITERLKADHFTEEEISRAFEVIAEKRQGNLLNLVQNNLEEEPSLSRNALISKLTENSYSQEEIEQGLGSIDVDWKEQAVKASEEYINNEVELGNEFYAIISRKCLRQFLIEEKEFTLEEVNYGLKESAIDWEEQAFKQAKYYLEADAYSKKGLINKLILDEFTKEEATCGVTKTQTNWEEQAVKKAESFFVHSLLHSEEELMNFLRREGFTDVEVNYAVNVVFKKAADELEEDEFEVKEPSVDSSAISVPQRPIIIKPIEFVTSHVAISVQAVTKKPTDSKYLSFNEPASTTTKKPQTSNKEVSRVAEAEIEEDTDAEDETSLFDSPVFAPVIMVLVVGNLYLFQKS